MNEPLVCAIMLTKDRSEMAARAVRAFREQTYQNKRLLVFDTGERDQPAPPDEGISYWHRPEWKDTSASIGELRNISIGLTNASIIVTWDSDDASHPNRIAEQVAHLQSSGADVVGYSELLFWRKVPSWAPAENIHGEAWLYKAPHGTAPGTSLAYWRKTWERKPFPDMPKNKQSTGEDVAWVKGLNLATVSGIAENTSELGIVRAEPRLIASIHGGNTMAYDLEGMIARGSREWRRAPEWYAWCREKVQV